MVQCISHESLGIGFALRYQMGPVDSALSRLIFCARMVPGGQLCRRLKRRFVRYQFGHGGRYYGSSLFMRRAVDTGNDDSTTSVGIVAA